MSKTYWLIERGSPARWWKNGYFPVGGASIEVWTDNTVEALRFDEKHLAEHEIGRLRSFGMHGPLEATEHMDCSGPDHAKVLMDSVMKVLP